jgi:dTMP kinase
MAIVTSGLIPNLTLLLDIDPLISLARKTDLDRIEQRGSFLNVVRHAFLDMAASQPDRWVVIDAARPADDVFSDVLEAVLKRLKLAEA